MRRAEWLEMLRYFSLITWIGLVMAVSIFIGWWLGAKLEVLLGGSGWTILGFVIGVASGGVALWSTLKKMIPWE